MVAYPRGSSMLLKLLDIRAPEIIDLRWLEMLVEMSRFEKARR